MRILMRYALLAASVLVFVGIARAASVPSGTVPETLHLAALPDPGLVGQKVDVIARRLSNNSAQALKQTIVLRGVLLVSTYENEWAASDRQATLALSPQEAKKLSKFSDRIGVDLLIQAH